MGLSLGAAPSYKNRQMLHLLWSLLDIGVLLIFIFLCYKTAVLIRKKVNLFVSILFVLVLLSVVNAADKSPEINNGKSGFVSGRPGPKGFEQTKSISITSQNDLLFHIGLFGFYGRDDSAGLYPISASSTITGLVAGYKWIPSSTLLDTAEGKIRYHFSGILDWQLLGITCYAQEKTFTGFVTP
jgi:hypothetical protein